MSPKAKAARIILENGGQWRVALETDTYTGYSKFKYRLMFGGRTIKGYGFKTFCELESRLIVAGGGTTVSTYYKLTEVVYNG